MKHHRQQSATVQRDDDSRDGSFSASSADLPRRQSPTSRSFSASASYAMTGDVGPALRYGNRPIPYFGVDDPVPYALTDAGMCWGDQ